MIRIGFIIYGRLDTLTGGYLYDRIVVDGLIQLGHEVEVISLPAGSYPQHLKLAFSPRLYRRLLAGGFDILIVDELCHPSLFLLKHIIRRHAERPILVALVHHVLCNEPRPPWRNMLFSQVEHGFLTSVDGFIHNSKTTRKTVASMVGHNHPQVIAYPAGDRFGSPLSPETIANRSHDDGPLELLFLGIVIPRKGLLPLLKALAGVDRGAWRLSIVGDLDVDPAYTRKAQRLTRQLGLSASVRFLGPLQNDDLTHILSTSHIFCMPYAYEGFGIAILEAMAFGLPAIGCRNGAAWETINHGTTGYLLNPDDLAGLAPLLLQLHRDRKKLQQLALAARETYSSSPSWGDSIAAIDTFLRKLIESPDVASAQNPRNNDPGGSDAPG